VRGSAALAYRDVLAFAAAHALRFTDIDDYVGVDAAE